MTTLEIYGASDDLIEVEGDITEEFNPDEGSGTLAFSDGTLLEVKYGEGGLWKITRVAKGTAQFSLLVEATDPDSSEYSDKAQLSGDVQWVALVAERGLARAPSKSPRASRVTK